MLLIAIPYEAFLWYITLLYLYARFISNRARMRL